MDYVTHPQIQSMSYYADILIKYNYRKKQKHFFEMTVKKGATWNFY